MKSSINFYEFVFYKPVSENKIKKHMHIIGIQSNETV